MELDLEENYLRKIIVPQCYQNKINAETTAC